MAINHSRPASFDWFVIDIRNHGEGFSEAIVPFTDYREALRVAKFAVVRQQAEIERGELDFANPIYIFDFQGRCVFSSEAEGGNGFTSLQPSYTKPGIRHYDENGKVVYESTFIDFRGSGGE